MVRSAFTLIELIFAIVVISISIVSLPMMIQTTSKGMEGNVLQEVLFAAESILTESTTYYWDSTSIEDNVTNSRVINANAAGDCSGATPSRRLGHINRVCLDDNTSTPLNGANIYALENAQTLYNDNNISIITGVEHKAAYKGSYSATVSVTNCTSGCIQFGLEDPNPNLKEIEIIMTKTGSADPLVVLKAYSANIGEVTIQSRTF